MYFQNPFGVEFRQTWPIDQQARFSIGANLNNIGQQMISGATEPYDFSVVSDFVINYAFDLERIAYSTLTVNVAGVTPGATTASEVVALLNADSTFSSYFVASLRNELNGSLTPPYKILITVKRPKQAISVYITNAGAEQILQFNYKAKVAELPTYFDRYTIANRFLYPDEPHELVALNPGDPVDAAVITAAGFDPLVVQTDWELLHGRSNTHMFNKMTYDGSGRLTTVIEYFAGSVAGDMGRKVQYTYTGASTSPDQVTTVPYTLQSSDLVTPP